MGIFGRRHKTVNVVTAKQLIADGATLLDVRSDKEWRAGHIDGAVHLPVDQLAGRLGEFAIDTPVVTVCHSGVRSALAARKLAAAGFQVTNVRGGMIAWNRSR